VRRKDNAVRGNGGPEARGKRVAFIFTQNSLEQKWVRMDLARARGDG
jgi:hypothetical protein